MLCEEVTSGLVKHLQLEFEAHPIEGGCVVVTPYSLPDLASMEFYVEPKEGAYLLTDEGETFNTLFISGMTTQHNDELMREARRIARAHGVKLDRSVLSLVATGEELGPASQRLLSAMQALSFLVYKVRHQDRPSFDDSVADLLDSHDVSYTPNYTIQGAASTHHIVFYVNSSRNIMIEPLSAHSAAAARGKAKGVAYKWFDIQQAYPDQYRFVTILDDQGGRGETVWSDHEAISPLTTYSTQVLRWTYQQDALLELVAA